MFAVGCDLTCTCWIALHFKKERVDGPLGDCKHQENLFQASEWPCIVSRSEKTEASTNKEVVGSDFGKWEKRKKLLTTMRKLDATWFCWVDLQQCCGIRPGKKDIVQPTGVQVATWACLFSLKRGNTLLFSQKSGQSPYRQLTLQWLSVLILFCRGLFLHHLFQFVWNSRDEDSHLGVGWSRKNNHSLQVTSWRSCYHHSE